MSLTEEQDTDEDFTIAGFGLYVIYSAVMIVICTIHSYRFFQDLCTKERKSVSHRETKGTKREKPEMNRLYKLIAWATELSIIFWTIATLVGFLTFFAKSNDPCDVSLTMVLTFIQTAKTLVYIVLLARLFRIYQHSPYNYPLRCIKFFIVLLIIYGVAAVLGLGFVTKTRVNVYNDPDKPNWCTAADSNFMWLLMGAIIFTEDLAVAFGFISAFVVPLRKTIKAVKLNTESNKNKILHHTRVANKIVYFGTKMAILTAVPTIATLVFGIITIITGTGFLYAPDHIVNAVCIAFMTAYYPNKRYYERYCFVCMLCCDTFEEDNTRKLDDLVNDKLEYDEKSKKVSINTMDQLRVVGKQLNVNYAGVYLNVADDDIDIDNGDIDNNNNNDDDDDNNDDDNNDDGNGARNDNDAVELVTTDQKEDNDK